jgi:hypothetical protein
MWCELRTRIDRLVSGRVAPAAGRGIRRFLNAAAITGLALSAPGCCIAGLGAPCRTPDPDWSEAYAKAAFIGGAGELFGDDMDVGGEGFIGKGFGAWQPGFSALASARYVPRGNQIANKTFVALVLEGRYDVVRGTSPLRVYVGAGTGYARETSSYTEDYYGDGSSDAATSPLFRFSTGMALVPPLSRWSPFADFGYEIYPAQELNNKTVLRAGIRFLLTGGPPASAGGNGNVRR